MLKPPIRHHVLSSQRAACPFPKSFAHASFGQLSVEKPNSFFRAAELPRYTEVLMGISSNSVDVPKQTNECGTAYTVP